MERLVGWVVQMVFGDFRFLEVRSWQPRVPDHLYHLYHLYHLFYLFLLFLFFFLLFQQKKERIIINSRKVGMRR